MQCYLKQTAGKACKRLCQDMQLAPPKQTTEINRQTPPHPPLLATPVLPLLPLTLALRCRAEWLLHRKPPAAWLHSTAESKWRSLARSLMTAHSFSSFKPHHSVGRLPLWSSQQDTTNSPFPLSMAPITIRLCAGAP